MPQLADIIVLESVPIGLATRIRIRDFDDRLIPIGVASSLRSIKLLKPIEMGLFDAILNDTEHDGALPRGGILFRVADQRPA